MTPLPAEGHRDYRNGSYERKFMTRVGTLASGIPAFQLPRDSDGMVFCRRRTVKVRRLQAVRSTTALIEPRAALREVYEELSEQTPKGPEVLEEGVDDATAILTLPDKYRRRLRALFFHKNNFS